MKKVLLLTSLALHIFVYGAFAQSRFNRVTNIPVRAGASNLLNPWAGGINSPLISELDINGDGIHDMIVFDMHNNRLIPFINDGSAGTDAWHYAPEYISKFPVVNKWVLFYDYNCDGKKDMFTLSTSPPSGISAYRNDFSQPGGLNFTLVSPFLQETFATITTNIFASGVSIPTFNDIDNDGDMDILGYNSVPDGRIVYHRNLSMDNFGHCDSLKFEYRSGCFGNFTLRIGSTNSVSCFHCPCREAPPQAGMDEFDPVVYDPSEAARQDDTISSVFALDLDGDGDKEILIGDISSDNTLMIHNGGTHTAAEMDSQDTAFPSSDVSALFNGFHFHAYLDADNDGKKDLLVFSNEYENREGIWWYKNTGSNLSPVFDWQSKAFLQEDMIDVGENAAPVLFDYNNDGLLDLVVAGSVYQSSTVQFRSSLFLYRNTGTSMAPAFEFVTDDYAGISGFNYSSPIYPAFSDMDDDGDIDLLIGLEDGTLQYFNNSAGPGNPPGFQLAFPNFMGIDVGNANAPQVYDLNKDGKKDLLIGEKNGFVNYFENTGSVSSPFFSNIPSNDTLGCIVRQMSSSPDGFTVPFAFDSLGKTRLLVSNLSGNIFQYLNIDGNLNGCFTLVDSVMPVPESFRIKTNLSVSGADLNGDQLTDLVIGYSSGGVQIYYQVDPTVSIGEREEEIYDVRCYPNPAGESFTLSVNGFSAGEKFRMTMKTLQGTDLFTREFTGQTELINAGDLASGIYLIHLQSASFSLVKRIVIQR